MPREPEPGGGWYLDLGGQTAIRYDETFARIWLHVCTCLGAVLVYNIGGRTAGGIEFGHRT